MNGMGLLTDLSTRGIRVEIAGQYLTLEAPEGVLTDALVAKLREDKAEVLAALQERQADQLARITRHTMEAGAVPIWPVPWRQALRCTQCGPVYWGESGTVDVCPWCWIRADWSSSAKG